VENTKDISIKHITSSRQKLIEYMTKNNVKQSQISKELGVSKATLSLFINDSYTGDNNDVANKIEQFLNMGSAREALAREPEICLSISNTERILEKVEITHITNDILLIYGAAGCGKSTALKHYSNTHNGVIYVEADVTTASPRSILYLILKELGLETNGAMSKMMLLLIERLKQTNNLIIIDEAQHLTPKSFDTLRALNDKAGIGIVYSGNPSILRRMYGRKEEEFDQVYSRIGYHCELNNSYSIEDIKDIFKDFNINKSCIERLHKISRRKGGLRQMIKQYKFAVNIARALNEDFSTQHLDEVSKRMGITNII
jgi:DNA transposition AAA+ family ATPase